MKQGMRRKIGFAATAGLVLLVLAGLLGGADVLLDFLAKAVELGERGVGSKLRRAGVSAYWDFDDVRPREQIGRTPVVTGGTRLIGGRSGSARLFLPKEHGFVRTAVPLGALGESFSFSCWLRFPDTIPDDHQIFQYLAVKGGNIVLLLPDQEVLAGPAVVRGRFFHVAFTVDAADKRVRLYVDGAPVGEMPLRPLRHRGQPVCFGQENPTPPPYFALDEVSVWGRPLAPAEVGRLSRLHWSLAVDKAFSRVLMLGCARAARDAYRAFLLTVDLFNPFLHESRIFAAHLPSYALVLSKNDVKHFTHFFNEREENGLNAPGTSKNRRIELAEGDRMRNAVMELVTADPAGPEGTPKWTFTLEMLSEDGDPERKVLLRPIEGLPYLLDMLAGTLARECGLPVAAPELCTVSVNGTFEGIHLCSEVGRDRGSLRLAAPGAQLTLLQRLPVFRDEVLRDFDRRAATLQTALLSDRKSPLTSREILHEIRSQRRQLEAALPDRTTRSDAALVARVAGSLGEDLFLGDNPHASLVVGDLDLSTRRINGADLSFESLTPQVLGSDGRIMQPGEAVVAAGLRVSVRSGLATRTRDLSFTVLASRRRIPVLRVDAAGDPPARAMVASVVEFVEGDGQRSGLLEGRIRLRGNTALYRERNQKKYYHITLDKPYDAPGIGRTRRLFLISGWRDVSLMHDRLAYDLFRSFSEPGKPRYSPRVQTVELVLNGDYKGIYNLVNRVDADLLEFGKSTAGADRPVLYKAKGDQANFAVPVRGAYIQKVPDWRDGEYWGPFDTLITFIGQSTPAAFREGVERLIDVGNVIDFEILLKLTSNFEGTNYNLFLARKGGPDARFFIVPWDYDMTFNHKEVPSNALIARLHRDLPGYSLRVLERWRSLRGSQLSERELMARIDGLGAELAEGAGRNYQRWPNTPGETWQGKVQELRAFIVERLRQLDEHFAALEAR